MGGACSTYGESRGGYRVVVGKPEGKGLFGRPMCRWKDIIKMGLQEWDGYVGTGSSWLGIGAVGGHF